MVCATGLIAKPPRGSGERHIYKQLFFPWPEAIELMAGDQVEARRRADFFQSDYVWSWKTRVLSGDE
jgi:hypothetical protein